MKTFIVVIHFVLMFMMGALAGVMGMGIWVLW